MCVSQSFVYDKQTDVLKNACNNALFFFRNGTFTAISTVSQLEHDF